MSRPRPEGHTRSERNGAQPARLASQLRGNRGGVLAVGGGDHPPTFAAASTERHSASYQGTFSPACVAGRAGRRGRLTDDDVSRLAGHDVEQPLARLLLDAGAGSSQRCFCARSSSTRRPESSVRCCSSAMSERCSMYCRSDSERHRQSADDEREDGGRPVSPLRRLTRSVVSAARAGVTTRCTRNRGCGVAGRRRTSLVEPRGLPRELLRRRRSRRRHRGYPGETAGRPAHRRSAQRRRALPRCAGAGCTSRRAHCARGRPRLDLAAVGGDGEIGNRGVLGLTGAVAHHAAVAAAVREGYGVERLGQRPDLIDLDPERIRGALVDAALPSGLVTNRSSPTICTRSSSCWVIATSPSSPPPTADPRWRRSGTRRRAPRSRR